MRILEYIPDPFINALSWSLLHSIWQILIIALLWRISILLARKAPALIKQNLSIFALLAIPVVFAITFIKQYNIYNNVQRIAYVEFGETNTQSLQETASWYVLQKNNSVVSQFLDSYTPIIFWLYWLGIAIFSGWFIFSYSRLLYIRKKDLTPPPHIWMDVVRNVNTRINSPKGISLFLSPHVSVPAVVGFFKPVVLFPLAITASLTMQEVENILLHEYYHIRCKDHYVNAFQYTLEILFFYHPCTWWISQTLRAQREAKVDEWVVNQTNNPLNYAQTLLSLEENRKAKIHIALAATSSHNSLLNRIKNIMHMKTRTFNPGQKIAAILVIALAAFSLAWINPPSMMIFANNKTTDPAQKTQVNHQQTTLQSHGNNFQSSEPQPIDDHINEPSSIVLENGNTIPWQHLSEQDKAEIREAMLEARLAIREAMQEVQRELNSEEMKMELRQAREEVRIAMEEVNRELNSPEFKAEMQQAREEVRKALLEVNQYLHGEEFRTEMYEVSKELQNAMQEINKIDWAEIGAGINMALEEVGKSMEIIGPTLNEVLNSLDLGKLLQELEELEEEQNEENQP